MQAGATIAVLNLSGNISAYAPAHGQPLTSYMVAVYARGPGNGSRIVRRPLLVTISATRPGVSYLLRGPQSTSMDLRTETGNINVADYDGIVNAQTSRGDIRMLIPQYGQASVGRGHLSVIFASTRWPGTLHFSVGTGDAEIYVNENAKARVHLHTDDGSVFTDFPLRGSSHGTGETIDGPINGGAPREIDVEITRGEIRLLQLKPQI